MQPCRLALIGAGQIMRGSHLPAALALPTVEVAAIVDPVPERAIEAAAFYGRTIPHAARIEDVLGAVDGVVIGTPNHTHHALAKAALAAGVSALVEKPLTETAEDAAELVALARARGCVLATGYGSRFRESFLLVAAAVRDGSLGRVESFHHQDGSAGGWAPLAGYARAKNGGGGVLTVTGTHFLDRVTQWFGSPRIVDYADDAAGGPEANCTGLFEFDAPGGHTVRGRFHMSKTAKLGNATMIRTDRGVIRVADGEVPVTFRPHGSAMVHTLGLPGALDGFMGKTVFERQLEDFAAAIREKRDARVTPEQGLEQVRLVEALYAARRPLQADWRAAA